MQGSTGYAVQGCGTAYWSVEASLCLALVNTLCKTRSYMIVLRLCVCLNCETTLHSFALSLYIKIFLISKVKDYIVGALLDGYECQSLLNAMGYPLKCYSQAKIILICCSLSTLDSKTCYFYYIFTVKYSFTQSSFIS